MNAPNARYAHVFAIVRVDDLFEDSPLENRITITKVLLSEDAAEREVKRLNKLNKDKGAVYFWRVGRMERSPSG